jgi:hypothetical protein
MFEKKKVHELFISLNYIYIFGILGFELKGLSLAKQALLTA